MHYNLALSKTDSYPENICLIEGDILSNLHSPPPHQRNKRKVQLKTFNKFSTRLITRKKENGISNEGVGKREVEGGKRRARKGERDGEEGGKKG